MPSGIYKHKKGFHFSEISKKNLSEIHKKRGDRPPSRKGIKHTGDTKKKMRENSPHYWKDKKRNKEFGQKVKERNLKLGLKPPIMKGKNHPRWKGDKCITPINMRIRKSFEYKIWRKSVFERDNYRCVLCGKIGGKLNAHHIKSFAKYSELRFDINNGITMCEKCHKIGRKKSPLFYQN